MENLVGRKIRGFKYSKKIGYANQMDKFIGEIGVIKEQGSSIIWVYFEDFVLYNYPIDEAIKHLVEEEVDFSILNEKDVFYCELEKSKWLFIGDAFHYYNNGCLMLRIDVIKKHKDGWLCEKKDVKELRKATKEEEELFYKHFPKKETPQEKVDRLTKELEQAKKELKSKVKLWLLVYKCSDDGGIYTNSYFEPGSIPFVGIGEIDESGDLVLDIIEREYSI